jgi:hypothetical protein
MTIAKTFARSARILALTWIAGVVPLTSCTLTEGGAGESDPEDIGKVVNEVGICGNGTCECNYFSGTMVCEDGLGCPTDCCDGDTDCWATRGNDGTHYCRRMNESSYEWITAGEAASYCDSSSEVCYSRARCDGHTYWCESTPNGWSETADCGGEIECAGGPYRSCTYDCEGTCSLGGSYWSDYVMGGSPCVTSSTSDHTAKLVAMDDADSQCNSAYGQACCCFSFLKYRRFSTDCVRWWAQGRRPLASSPGYSLDLVRNWSTGETNTVNRGSYAELYGTFASYNNEVSIGGVECAVVYQSSSQINCQAGYGTPTGYQSLTLRSNGTLMSQVITVH